MEVSEEKIRHLITRVEVNVAEAAKYALEGDMESAFFCQDRAAGYAIALKMLGLHDLSAQEGKSLVVHAVEKMIKRKIDDLVEARKGEMK